MEEWKYKELLGKIEQKINVKSEDIYNIAKSVTKEDLYDENKLHHLVKKISNLAQIPITTEVENGIVDTIMSYSQSLQSAHLEKSINKSSVDRHF